MRKQRLISLCLVSALALSLAACNSPTDEQNSAQPTAAPTPPPTPPIPFTDVAQDSPYYDAVVWAYENGIASDGETFGPADACNRGQVMTFLWRAKGSPEPQATESPFRDVSSDDWFYKPALWAYETGVVAGTAFNPGSPCTNGEILTFLWRAEGRPMAAAASDAYYARPLSWAETNGLFAGTEFDPAAPCSRADLMTYLYWDAEEWTFTEEAKTLQTEYEYILNTATPFARYSNCLCWADYIDVDGDNEVELLTLEVSSGQEYHSTRTVTATVYGNVDGHAQKTCEQDFSTYEGDDFSTCLADGQLYLCQNVFSGNLGETYDYYKIEKNAITHCDQASFMWREGASEQDVATREKYTNQKSLLTISSDDVPSVVDRGIAPGWSWEEQRKYLEEHEEYWTQYWTNRWASDPVYATVLQGDFSAFAGTYHTPYGEELTLNKDGSLLANDDYYFAVNQKPVSINITSTGAIRCVITPVRLDDHYDEDFGEWYSTWHGDTYDICPIGVECDESAYINLPDTNSLRLLYTHWGGSAGAGTVAYYK